MAMQSCRIIGLGSFLAVAVLAACASISMSGPADGPQQPVNNDAINKLLNERRAVLKRLVKVQVGSYRTGMVEMQSITEAQRQLLDVEMELTTDRDKRVKLLQATVVIARELEKMAGERFKTGSVTIADVLRAQSMRLEAETDVLRARQK